jgi:hypothetical protein
MSWGRSKAVAQKASDQSQAVAAAASTALQSQPDHSTLLQAQLVVLHQKRAATAVDCLAGMKAWIGVYATLDVGAISRGNVPLLEFEQASSRPSTESRNPHTNGRKPRAPRTTKVLIRGMYL